VRRLLREARNRFIATPVTDRAGPQPENLMGLFSAAELHQLMRAGRWPLSTRDLAFVTGKLLQRVVYLRVAIDVEVN
jgi:hypothetical protein